MLQPPTLWEYIEVEYAKIITRYPCAYLSVPNENFMDPGPAAVACEGVVMPERKQKMILC
jgi:hypothetical protein